jgi:hypothetical protein
LPCDNIQADASYQSTTMGRLDPYCERLGSWTTQSMFEHFVIEARLTARKDPELWYEGGDCFVHLHAKGASRRGPSFCVPFRLLRQKKCDAMLNLCDAQIAPAPGSASQRLRRMPSSLNNTNRESNVVELFIPASEDSSQDSFRQHITTRNFFAFLLGKPLVGDHMGQAFVDLQERLQHFRPSHANNHQDFLDYAENQGYRDLVECTDYALASLFYAEHYKLRDTWVDAFAHCVGMSESLVLSPEYVVCILSSDRG